MGRTLTEIYSEAKAARGQYLQLSEIQNDSKMSAMDAFTWITSACIWSFENLLDVFKTDILKDLQNRVNGTPAYYSNAMLKFQYGDSLTMNEDGTQFTYPSIDESKRIITKTSYSEVTEDGFKDKELVLKVAKGAQGNYTNLTEQELIAARTYINQIAFAGTHIKVISRKGDILIPRVTVYHDGKMDNETVYENIRQALVKYIEEIDFDGVVYTQRVVDAIQSAEHVIDVHINESLGQGIYIAQYNDDNQLVPVTINPDGSVTSYEKKIERRITPSSGYIKESSGTGEESGLETWKKTISLVVESNEI